MEPTLRISLMEMMPERMEKKTMGTTTNFSKFRKMVPKGLI